MPNTDTDLRFNDGQTQNAKKRSLSGEATEVEPAHKKNRSEVRGDM
jgi:hypothetical protein